jgi:hypothetical protein
MDLYGVLHWLTDEVSKLAGQAEAKIIHDAIGTMERGSAPVAMTQPAEAEAPAVEQGAAEPSTAEVLAEVLAAIRGQQTAPVAPAPTGEEVTATGAAFTGALTAAAQAPGAPVVDPGQAPEA